MFKNYLRVAWRNFGNGKLYSLINVAGLAVGIACGILIFLFVSHELSYDKYHVNARRIYRVNEFFSGVNGGSGERSASIPFPMAEALALDYSNAIEEVVRFYNFQSPILTVAYEATEKVYNERKFFFVDSSYHKVFDLIMIKGNPRKALSNPNSVIISESTAKKYFNNEEALGKVLLFQGQSDLLITGVFKDMPSNSHFHADFLASFLTLKSFYDGQYPDNWHWNPCWTYLLLKKNNPEYLTTKFPDFIQKHLPDYFKNDVTLGLQPLTDIHLKSHLEFEIESNSSEDDVMLFSGIAVFVLLIACINFMNLSTARSMTRAKEVGMRKAIGGQKHQLIFQFMLESIMISFLAVIASVALVLLALPFFNNFSEKQLVLNLLDPMLLGGLLAIGFIVGIISGIYPAIVLTSFNAVKVLKSNKVRGKGLTFRKALVITQFVISIALIIVTGIAVRQVDFLQGSSMGFAKDDIVMVPIVRTPIAQNYKTLVDEALAFPGIEAITAVEEIVGAKHQSGDYLFEGMSESSLFSRLNVRHGFTKTFNIPLLAGRDYDIDNPSDDTLSVVVNETLVKGFNWTAEEAIGRHCQVGKYRRQIIGVTKDFNFASKHEAITPLILQLNNSPKAFDLNLKYLAVRINRNSTTQSLNTLKKIWKEFLPGRPFDYFFLDNELNNLYKSEANLINISMTFSLLAVVVACLGLFGLASFNAEQRKREVSIRKVLGSSTQQIVLLILFDYTRILIIAVFVANVAAWLLTNQWLSIFAYRIDMPLDVFVFASLFVTLVALLTVSYKSFLVASSNPVDSLRSE